MHSIRAVTTVFIFHPDISEIDQLSTGTFLPTFTRNQSVNFRRNDCAICWREYDSRSIRFFSIRAIMKRYLHHISYLFCHKAVMIVKGS